MNFENNGKVIARIARKNETKKDITNSKLIFVTDDLKKQTIDKFDLENEDDTIQQIPNKDIERSILYVSGPSGSGKSYYTRNYVLEYKRIFPKNSVYIFSSLDSDETLDKIKDIKRIKFNEDFLMFDFKVTDFTNSLVIFDDIDACTNRHLKTKIYKILEMLLNTGRHERVSIIYTSHLCSKGNETKLILSECMSITIFPRMMGKRSLQYLLENYFGLSTPQIKQLKKVDSRSVTICKTYPMVVIGSKNAFVLDNND
jgi:chromosomal replication initiation ATPase DnaA